MKVETEPS